MGDGVGSGVVSGSSSEPGVDRDVVGLGLDDGVGDGFGRGVRVEFEVDDGGVVVELGVGDGAGDGVGACTVPVLVAS